LIFLLSKTFYAAHNTKIPAWISFGTVILNIAMSLLFVRLLSFANPFYDFLQSVLKLHNIPNISVVGLALAFTVTAICESLILLYFIYKKLKILRLKNILSSMYKVMLAGVVMGVLILLVRDSLVYLHIVSLQTTLGVFLQLVISGICGLVAYIITAFMLKSREINMIKESFFKRFNKV